eukprot:CAMPEP_0197283378 /NCGR_PEP_ID=MMETSP1432-20130617/24901_1 /TAXON_ID=44447 /ORGANISM="Pseudo-nitzschia delicatissima, Strain UNC1205" /LENGTH=408 /DNA_ID=CAMNT_0042750367 /DNA_START=176 /DNA_END=1401 /DNA_ORIENTATION=-
MDDYGSFQNQTGIPTAISVYGAEDVALLRKKETTNSESSLENNSRTGTSRRISMSLLAGMALWFVVMAAELSPFLFLVTTDEYQSAGASTNNDDEYDDDDDDTLHAMWGSTAYNIRMCSVEECLSSPCQDSQSAPFVCLALKHNENIRGGCGRTSWDSQSAPFVCLALKHNESIRGGCGGHHGPLKFVPISAMLRAVPTFWNVRMLFPRAPTIFEPKKTATPSVLGTGAADTSSVATAKTLRTSALPAFPSLDAAPTSLSGPSDQPRRSVPPAARRPRVTIEENQRKEKRRKLVVTHTARVNKNMELKSTHIGLAEIYRFKQKEIDIAHENLPISYQDDLFAIIRRRFENTSTPRTESPHSRAYFPNDTYPSKAITTGSLNPNEPSPTSPAAFFVWPMTCKNEAIEPK